MESHLMNKHVITNTQCPVCRHNRAYLLQTIRSDEAAQYFVLKEADEQRFLQLKNHIEKLWQKDTCDIVVCANCSFWFANPFVAGDAIYYDLAHGKGSYPAWKWEFQVTYDTLKDLVEKNNFGDFTLLEIGAGDGVFVKKIVPELTAKENVLCTEFSKYGLDKITSQGIACVLQDVRDLDSIKYRGYFDVVCMFQILEHMDNLDGLFKQLNRLTSKRCHLFVAVPNPTRCEFLEQHGAQMDMPPHHTGRWNPDSFAEIAQRYKWMISKHEVEPFNFASVKYFIYQRYIQKRQSSKTFASQVEQIRNIYLRRGFQILAAVLHSSLSLPAIMQLMRSDKLGNSFWLHMKKLA